jgi:2-iminoacetate synthase
MTLMNTENTIKQHEIDKYSTNGEDFVDEKKILDLLEETRNPDKYYIKEILDKSLSIERLTPRETASLMNVNDPGMLQQMVEAGLEVKRRVYDNRVVFFAPLYCSNFCVNGCRYCGFASGNSTEKRRCLTSEEIEREAIHVLAEGHKRMIVVFGEHPMSDVDYICKTMETIYNVQGKTPRGTTTSIRRINVGTDQIY